MRTLTFLLFFFPLVAQAQLHPQDSSAITTIMDRQQACWNNGDLECFMKGYWESNSLRYLGATGGVRYGWQSTLDRYKKTYPDKATMGKLAFTHISMEYLSPSVILVLGKWHLARDEDKGDLNGVYTLIWKKMGDSWVIVYDHSS